MLEPHQLHAILTEIWTVVLDLDLEPLDTDPDCAAADPSPVTLTASVRFGGPQEGIVSLGFDATLADRVTRHMLALHDRAPSDEDLRDALGEIVNIVGGHVKAFGPATARLGLPRVDAGAAADPSAGWTRCVVLHERSSSSSLIARVCLR